ncbi:MAG TPA: ribosome biogenesis GTP-binding protein YihA/YsxC [Candidatus Kapabacteria bacterium]|jgi:GTP-binding protein
MKFSATFLSSFSAIEQLPKDGKPEIAVIGRSNVGKSSLINALAERKQLAKTSATPGKTRTLNFYEVNGTFYLVDMPGYGYAKQAKSDRADWARLTERYFLERKELTAVGLLVDARHPALESDLVAIEWFRDKKVPIFIVLTKCDKSKQAEVAQHEKALSKYYHVPLIFRTSSVKGLGMLELKKNLQKIAEESNFGGLHVFPQSSHE